MPQTRTIDGLSVTCTPLGATDAYDLLPELLPVLGLLIGARGLLPVKAPAVESPAVEAPSVEDIAAKLAKIDTDAIARLFGQAARELGGGRVSAILLGLMRNTVVGVPSGKGVVSHRIDSRAAFDLAFEGRMWSAFSIAAFAFEVTFGNFSDVASMLGGLSGASAARPSAG